MSQVYTPAAVANFFLRKSEEEGRSLTQLKLMKLAYLAFGWALAVLDRELFPDDFEAWDHGPVVPALYHEFKRFGASPIMGRARELDLETMEFQEPEIDPNDEDALIVLDKVWNVYKNFSAWALRNKTHESGTPWRKAFQPGVPHIEIPKRDIQEHFRNRIQRYLDD